MDFSKFRIERNIPFPVYSRPDGGTARKWIEFYDSMQPGDSFIGTEANLNGFKVALKKFGYYPPKTVITASKIGPNSYRIWKKFPEGGETCKPR